MMKIIKEGSNPFIQQGKCKTCHTVVEVDVRKECTEKMIDRYTVNNDCERSVYANVAPCPTCELDIIIGKVWTKGSWFEPWG